MLKILRRCRREMEPVDPAGGALPDDVVWLDMLQPSAAEIGFVQRTVSIEMPTREEMREIEASARVYEEGDGLFMTATVMINADTPPPGTTEVTFITVGDRLVTLRYEDPQPFRSMAPRLERQGGGLTGGLVTFFWLIDALIARLADILERRSLDVDALSGRIFNSARLSKGEERPDMLEAIERIGRNGDAASKVRESLHTLQRLLFAMSTTDNLPPTLKKDTRTRAKQLIRDVQSLTDHAGFLSSKTAFLLDATLGMINIEQNAIIKIFSIAAVVFLPPTLIASIYGMNFEVMPELRWAFGYPLAVLLMLFSAALPIIYFKRRGWL